MKYGKLCISSTLAKSSANVADAGSDSVVVGVDDPRNIKREVVEKLLKDIPGRRFVAAHVPYSVAMEQLVGSLGYKGVLVTRDPRDVVASHVPFILKTKSHYLHDYYKSLEDDDTRLMMSITGFSDQNAGVHLESIDRRIRSMLMWSESSYFISVKFENLIGAHGGGDPGIQCCLIEELAQHVGIALPAGGVGAVAESMIGKGYTFRKGVIGGWRSVLNGVHKAEFKRLAGKLLIELGYEKDLDW